MVVGPTQDIAHVNRKTTLANGGRYNRSHIDLYTQFKYGLTCEFPIELNV